MGTKMNESAVEKTNMLLILLEAIASTEILREKVCLHGGTALNLFILDAPRLSLDAPRLSLDADLNYIGNIEREAMLDERPLIDQMLTRAAQSIGLRVEAGPDQHAGRTYKMIYASHVTGQRDFVKVDMDYLNRAPLISPMFRESAWGEKTGIAIKINAPIEIAGGKLMALLGRVVPRDLYDTASLAKSWEVFSTGDKELDRKIMLYYLTLAEPFPRPLSIRERFLGIKKEFEENLLPVLLGGDEPNITDMIDTVEDFVREISEPRTGNEKEYLELMSRAVFTPELLFEGYPDVLSAAKASPNMMWKMQNLRKVGRKILC